MKAILEFNLPEEHVDMLRTCRVGELVTAINEFRQWLRNERDNEDQYDLTTLDAVWFEFHDALSGLIDE